MRQHPGVETPGYCRVVPLGRQVANAEAIKDCIRRNEHVAITLYRDFAPAVLSSQPSTFTHLTQDRLPLHAMNS